MKKYLVGVVLSLVMLLGGLSLFTGTAEAASYVRGYYKPSTGTYVQPYYRSSPNSTRFDNYSTRGNYNPYTGMKGYKSPYSRW